MALKLKAESTSPSLILMPSGCPSMQLLLDHSIYYRSNWRPWCYRCVRGLYGSFISFYSELCCSWHDRKCPNLITKLDSIYTGKLQGHNEVWPIITEITSPDVLLYDNVILCHTNGWWGPVSITFAKIYGLTDRQGSIHFCSNGMKYYPTLIFQLAIKL